MNPPRLLRRFRARPEEIGPVRRDVRAYAQRHGVLDPDAVALAVSEAVSNVVLHAYADAPEPGEVEVVAERHLDNGLVLSVCDGGRAMRPRSDSPGMGVALPLVASLADSLSVESRP